MRGLKRQQCFVGTIPTILSTKQQRTNADRGSRLFSARPRDARQENYRDQGYRKFSSPSSLDRTRLA